MTELIGFVRLKPIMKLTLVLLSLIAATAQVESFDNTKSDYSAKAQVLWQTETPSCFTPDVPLSEQMEEVNENAGSGKVAPPKIVTSTKPSPEMFEGEQIPRSIPVFELVINATGRVESVVALRPTSEILDARLAKDLRGWTFEPSTLDGKPICSIYIVTLFIDWT